jgi:hypothetical protein
MLPGLLVDTLCGLAVTLFPSLTITSIFDPDFSSSLALEPLLSWPGDSAAIGVPDGLVGARLRCGRRTWRGPFPCPPPAAR